MAEERRTVAADSPDRARAAAQALVHQGYELVSETAGEIVVRKARRRGDEVVVIRVMGRAGPAGALPPPPPPPPPIVPPGAPRSDDGRWWWDGAKWNPIA
jgi:hypothetical protein